jgi:hypothetical protein
MFKVHTRNFHLENPSTISYIDAQKSWYLVYKWFKNLHFSELLEDADSLLCATTGALFVVNLSTCQPMKIIDFRGKHG